MNLLDLEYIEPAQFSCFDLLQLNSRVCLNTIVIDTRFPTIFKPRRFSTFELIATVFYSKIQMNPRFQFFRQFF